MTEKEDSDARSAVLGRMKAMASHLMEHGADSVQVFVTKRHPDGTTVGIHHGEGDYYARLGNVQEWVTMADERARHQVWSEEDEDDD